MTLIAIYSFLAAIAAGGVAAVGFWVFIGSIAAVVALLFLCGACAWLYHKIEPNPWEYYEWFAWRPVKMFYGPWVWLQIVERRGWTGIYREVGYDPYPQDTD